MKHLDLAETFIGQSENWGNNDSAFIQKCWQSLSKSWAWLRGQPWCGGFVAYVLKESGLPVIKEYYRAKAWVTYGNPLAAPELGCIAILSRIGGGHVAFVYGMTDHGEVILLGGNQGNKVSLMTANPSDCTFRSVPDGLEKFEPIVYAGNYVSAKNQRGVFS
jgi:uncharacterized protein (TIGR02594 family)